MAGFIQSSCLMPARCVNAHEPMNLSTELLLSPSNIKSEPVDEDEAQEDRIFSVTKQNTKIKRARDSDEDTESAFESDEATLTADSDTDQNMDSDSTVFNDKDSFNKRRRHSLKMKEETPTSDEDKNLKAPDSLESHTKIVIKQEPVNECEYNNTNGTRENLPHGRPSTLEEKKSASDSEYFLTRNEPGNFLASNMRIKKEKEADDTQSQEKDGSAMLALDYLEHSITDADKHSENAAVVSKLSAEDTTVKLGNIKNRRVPGSFSDDCEYNKINEMRDDLPHAHPNTFEEEKISDSEYFLTQNKPDSFLASNMRIKKEKEADDTQSQEKDDCAMLARDYLEHSITDADKHSENAVVVGKLSAEDTTDKSGKIKNRRGLGSFSVTENLESVAISCNALPNSMYDSESCTNIMKISIQSKNCTSEITKSINMPQNSASQSEYIINNSNSADNMSEYPLNKSEMRKHEGSSRPTLANNPEAINEDACYLYTSPTTEISKNKIISLSHSSSPMEKTVLTAQLHSAVADGNEIASPNSTLFDEAGVSNYTSLKKEPSESSTVPQKAPAVSENTLASVGSDIEVRIASRENNIFDKSVQVAFPVLDNKTKSAQNNIECFQINLLEFSKYFLNFNKSDIEKCLNHIKINYPQNKSLNRFLYSTKTEITAQSEKTNILSTVNAETQNIPPTQPSNSPPLSFAKPPDVCTENSKLNYLEGLKKMNQTAAIPKPASDNDCNKNMDVSLQGSKISSVENSSKLIPTNEELQKIIETASLLNNPTPSSENKLSPLNSPSIVTGKDRNEAPEIEVIVLDSEEPSLISPTVKKAHVTSTDEIEILTIKKKRHNLQKTLSSVPNRFGCYENRTRNDKNASKFQCDTASVSNESDTRKRVAKVDEGKNREISNFQQNLANIVDKTHCNKVNNARKNKNISAIANKVDTGNSSEDKMKKNNIECTPSLFDASGPGTNNDITKNLIHFNSIKKEKRDIQNNPEGEPPVKKIKTAPIAYKEDSIKSSNLNTIEKRPLATNDRTSKDKIQFSVTSVLAPNESSNFAGKRKAENETGNKKKVKLPSEEEKHLKKEHVDCSEEICSKVFENKYRKQSILNNEVSSSVASFQFSKQAECEPEEYQENRVTSSSDYNSGDDNSANAACRKVFTSESKIQNPSKLRNEASSSEAKIQSAKQTDTNPEANRVPIIFLGRKGKNFASSRCLHKKVGKQFIDINEFPSLILEWNTNWLLTQKETKKCAPICDGYTPVKDSYQSELDYYNTYFPLHFLSMWLEISDTWKKCPKFFESVLESQVEKPYFIKITLLSVLNVSGIDNWPKQEDIVICKIAKPDGSEESLFARVCSVVSKDYSPPENSSLKKDAFGLKRVKFELFCAELLAIPLWSTVQVQILCNIRIALLQNDALQHLNSSMKDIILDPKKHLSRWKFITLLPSHHDAYNKCMKSIVDSVTSRTVRITVVDTTPLHRDEIFAIPQLVIHLKKKGYPVLIGLKNEDSFLQLAKLLNHCNLILAIKARDVKLPEELRKFTLEERSAEFPGGEIFRNWHVTLTLLSSVFLGDFARALADQNLTCILHEAHLYTEAETALLLYYDAKNLVLMGNQEAQPDVQLLLKRFGYNISLFNRFCKAV